MSGNSAFLPVTERGWRGGLTNLLRAGFGQWWQTNLWWTMSLIWFSVVNFILAGILWGSDAFDLDGAVTIYTVFAGLFPPIAVVIVMQDAIVGEKESGTAAWILSKPVSRAAFILSKLIPNAVGFLVTMVLLPAAGVYGQLWVRSGQPLAWPGFAVGLVVLWAHLLFYLTLTLMLGTFFSGRGAVIGVPLAFAFGQQLLLSTPLKAFLPWGLMVPVGDGQSQSVVGALVLGQTPATLTPVWTVLAGIVIFTLVSLWQFERTEF